MVTGDIYHIEERLKDIDPDITLDFNPNNGNYPVFHKGYFVMEWPRPLDARLLTHMRKIDMRRRGYDPFKEIDEHNERLEQSLEKDRLDNMEQVAKYYQPRFRNEIDGIQMKTVF